MSLPITQGSSTRVISRAAKSSTTALRAGLGAACFVVLAVLTGVVVLSYRSMLRVEEDQRWVGHAYLVLQKLDEVFVHLISAETSQRGYLLSSKKSYLSSRQPEPDNLRDDLKDIGRLTKDNPRQQQTLQQLERLVSTQLSEFQNEMTLGEREVLIDAVGSGAAGKRSSLSEIISHIAQMKRPVDFQQFRASVKQSSLYWLVVNQPPPPAAFQEK